jgi:hypothetical protein
MRTEADGDVARGPYMLGICVNSWIYIAEKNSKKIHDKFNVLLEVRPRIAKE